MTDQAPTAAERIDALMHGAKRNQTDDLMVSLEKVFAEWRHDKDEIDRLRAENSKLKGKLVTHPGGTTYIECEDCGTFTRYSYHLDSDCNTIRDLRAEVISLRSFKEMFGNLPDDINLLLEKAWHEPPCTMSRMAVQKLVLIVDKLREENAKLKAVVVALDEYRMLNEYQPNTNTEARELLIHSLFCMDRLCQKCKSAIEAAKGAGNV